MNVKKFLVSMIAIVAVVVFVGTFFEAIYYNSSDEIVLPKEDRVSNNKANPSLYPVKLTIPKINVNTNVTQVGITKKGNMATPNNFTEVGWYKYGTVPGERGSAVIAGHLDNGLAFPAVFSDLKNLKKGDDIYITTAENKLLHFVVMKSDVYDFNASTASIFGSSDNKLLKLITCTGDWISAYKTHNKRLVVSALLVS